MKAEYELTPGDLAAFADFHFRRSPHLRRRWLAGMAMGLAVVSLLPGYLLLTSARPLGEAIRALWPVMLAPVLFLMVFPFLYQWTVHRTRMQLVLQARRRGLYGRCAVSIDAQGITGTKPTGSGRRRWQSVHRIAVTPVHLFIYTSASEAFIVPARAFGTADEFERFLQEVSHRSQAARKEAAAAPPLN